jgi:hypothetical protein
MGAATIESKSTQMSINAAKYVGSMLAVVAYGMGYIPFWLLVVLLMLFDVIEKLIRTSFEDR